jgi:hypothetical protein
VTEEEQGLCHNGNGKAASCQPQESKSGKAEETEASHALAALDLASTCRW